MATHELVTHRDKRAVTAIVLIHGFGGDATVTWGRFLELLAADPSLRGWDVFSVGYATSLPLDVSGIWAADSESLTLGAVLDTAAVRRRSTTSQPDLLGPQHGRPDSAASACHDAGSHQAHRCHSSSVRQERAREATWYRVLAEAAGTRHGSRTGRSSLVWRGAWSQTFAKPVPFKFLAIAGDRDEFVPRASSIDPFPKEVQCVVYGHQLQIVKPEDANHLGFQRPRSRGLPPGTDRD